MSKDITMNKLCEPAGTIFDHFGHFVNLESTLLILFVLSQA